MHTSGSFGLWGSCLSLVTQSQNWGLWGGRAAFQPGREGTGGKLGGELGGNPSPPDLHSAVAAGTSEHDKLCRARDQCRDILKYVNEAVKQAENRHRLEGYQKRLDATSLERTSNPLAAEFKVAPSSWGDTGGGSAGAGHAHRRPLLPPLRAWTSPPGA